REPPASRERAQAPGWVLGRAWEPARPVESRRVGLRAVALPAAHRAAREVARTAAREDSPLAAAGVDSRSGKRKRERRRGDERNARSGVCSKASGSPFQEPRRITATSRI